MTVHPWARWTPDPILLFRLDSVEDHSPSDHPIAVHPDPTHILTTKQQPGELSVLRACHIHSYTRLPLDALQPMAELWRDNPHALMPPGYLEDPQILSALTDLHHQTHWPALLLHPACTTSFRNALGHVTHDPILMANILHDPALNGEVISRFHRLTDRDWIKELIAGHPHTPDDLLDILFRTERRLHHALATRSDCPQHWAIHWATIKGYPLLRAVAARHPDLPIETLLLLAKDSHPTVRDAVRENPRTPEAIRIKLSLKP